MVRWRALPVHTFSLSVVTEVMPFCVWHLVKFAWYRSDCMASIGAVSNQDQQNIKIGKAGRNRWLGKRPHVRGVVMNPVDHPHGGGEGKTSGGRHPVTFGVNQLKVSVRVIIRRRIV